MKIVPLPDFGRGNRHRDGLLAVGCHRGRRRRGRGLAVPRLPPEAPGGPAHEPGQRGDPGDGQLPSKLSPRFAEGGAEHLFIEQLKSGVARPRSQTPAYPAVSVAFSRAFAEIMLDRAPVQAALDKAVRRIDKDLADHQGYPSAGP